MGEDYLQNFRYQCFTDGFFEICNKVLDKDAPYKETSMRGKHSRFVNRELSKVIMVRTRKNKTFRNNFKTKKTMPKCSYKRQRNYFVRLLKRANKDYYSRFPNNRTGWTL